MFAIAASRRIKSCQIKLIFKKAIRNTQEQLRGTLVKIFIQIIIL